MGDKKKESVESSHSSSNMSETYESSNGDSSSSDEEEETENPESRLISTVTTAKNNFLQIAKPLKTWHQFVLQKVLYNKDYVYLDTVFCWVQRKTTVKREQILYTVIFLLVAFVLLQNFDPLLCALVSCFYPAYETTRSLTIHKRRAHKERKHWLIYWIVFSFFTLQDYYTERLTKLFPPLLLLKMLFLVLLALPQTGVAELCYYNIAVPVLSIVNDAFTKYNVRPNDAVAEVAVNESDAEEDK